jgi:hypothetical protein
MTIPMLHTAEGLWCDRSPVPMTPARAEDNPHPFLRTLDTARVGELTPAERARLADSAMNVFEAFPDQAPDWHRVWGGLHSAHGQEEHHGLPRARPSPYRQTCRLGSRGFFNR